MTDVRDDDPYGDKAYLEQRRQRGRSAILNQAEDFRPEREGGDADDDDRADDPADGGGDGEADDAYRFDHVRIPRFFGSSVRYVAISLPDNAPITPLGKDKRMYWYLSPLGELIGLTDGEHGQAHIEGLWSPRVNDLHRAFPQFNQQRQFKGFQAQYARSAMMAACGAKGIFDAHDRVRGLGCWRDDDGQLVQHLGDVVLVGTAEHQPGEIGRYVYPGRPPIERPAAGGRDAARKIYERLQTWNWARCEIDARLLLGQYCSIILGAAIDWRPMGFITGDAATGKSTLQRFGRSILGRRMLSTVDASEAALRGMLGQDSVGVSFDEIEADALNDRAQQVMKLARTAASGDDAHRSSQSQDIRSFTLRGSFLFSAIIPPSMRQADMQRFTFFRLNALAKGAKQEPLTPTQARELGAGLVGRLTSQWHRWERTLAIYTAALERLGHAQRGALQFGTLLAGAWLVMEDGEPTDADLDAHCTPLRRETLFEYENTVPTWLQAWRHLMSAQPEVWRSDGFPTVAEMVRRYLDVRSKADKSRNLDDKKEATRIHDKLTRAGLAIVRQRVTGRTFLAIPPSHQAVASIFAGTDYQKRGGEGAWTTPMRGADKIEGDRGVLHVEKVPRLDRQKCTLYWLDGQAEIGGVWTPIFERHTEEDEIDAPVPERVEAYLAAIRACTTHADLEKTRDLARGLEDRLAIEDPAGLALAHEAFNAKWAEIEDAQRSS